MVTVESALLRGSFFGRVDLKPAPELPERGELVYGVWSLTRGAETEAVWSGVCGLGWWHSLEVLKLEVKGKQKASWAGDCSSCTLMAVEIDKYPQCLALPWFSVPYKSVPVKSTLRWWSSGFYGFCLCSGNSFLG